MKKKRQIIIVSCILAVIVLALVATIVIYNLKSDTETNEEPVQVWKEAPFDYSSIITKYDSYKEAFREAISDLRTEMEEVSGENECALNIVSAYMTEKNTPTLIVVYDNPDGGNNVMICKYANNRLYKTFVHGGEEKIGNGCELLIVQDSNAIVFRSGLCKSLGTQSIYSFDGDDKYDVDRTENFDVAPLSEYMDQMLADYFETDNPATLSYSELAVCENVNDVIDDFVND